MVLLDSTDGFLNEVVEMFALCKERGAGTVYVTIKKNQRDSKGEKVSQGGGEAGGDGGEGWLARAKISNKKKRKLSITVRKRCRTARGSGMVVCAVCSKTYPAWKTN